MVCYNPFKGFQIGFTASGKPDYKLTSYYVDHVEFDGKNWILCPTDRVSDNAVKVVKDFQEIPCGKCIGCRMDYSKQWADRCLLEMQQHESNMFLTLTYDDDHLTYSIVEDSDGFKSMIPTLSKRDFQLFLKRLRDKLDYPIRYFCAGEYGGQTLRPHYHAIIFGLKVGDLKWYKRERGYDYFTSEWLASIWQHGAVIVAPANWQTAAYVARYTTKKAHGQDAAFFESKGMEPEFSLMSRRPGIGRDFFDKNVERIFSTDSIFLATPDGSHEIKPCRYFKKLMEMSDPDRYELLKQVNQEVSESATTLIHEKNSMSHIDYLQSAQMVKEKSLSKLVRDTAVHEQLFPDPVVKK